MKPIRRIFDRIPRFDRRSRLFAARDSFWWGTRRKTRNWSCYTVLDQGREGACVGFAVSHEAAATPAVVLGITNKVARAMYRRAQQLDEWPGENYEGSSVLGGMKAGKEKGWWKEYRWAFGERELALSIGYLGPCVLGINWYEGMNQPDAMGRIRPTGALLGGHAILCMGYDAKKKLYRLHNSWGPKWGIGGDCFISAKVMATLLNRRGEAAVPIKRMVPAGKKAK